MLMAAADGDGPVAVSSLRVRFVVRLPHLHQPWF
jgi:hypothetical protein